MAYTHKKIQFRGWYAVVHEPAAAAGVRETTKWSTLAFTACLNSSTVHTKASRWTLTRDLCSSSVGRPNICCCCFSRHVRHLNTNTATAMWLHRQSANLRQRWLLRWCQRFRIGIFHSGFLQCIIRLAELHLALYAGRLRSVKESEKMPESSAGNCKS